MAYFLVILFMAVGFAGMRTMTDDGRQRMAIVERKGSVIQSVNLEQGMDPQTIRVDAGEGRYNIIWVGYDEVHVAETNCPDQVCLTWGGIRYAGQLIVCLPFEIVIRIVGQQEEMIIDDITW